jgi:hypothetical protein
LDAARPFAFDGLAAQESVYLTLDFVTLFFQLK